jgi:hypothetical protein
VKWQAADFQCFVAGTLGTEVVIFCFSALNVYVTPLVLHHNIDQPHQPIEKKGSSQNLKEKVPNLTSISVTAVTGLKKYIYFRLKMENIFLYNKSKRLIKHFRIHAKSCHTHVAVSK